MSERMTFDRIKSLLESIQAQIRAFDSKAQVLLGVNGVLAGFISAELAKTTDYGLGMPKRIVALAIVLSIAAIAALISFGLSLRVLNPQLHLSQPHSNFFFCHIAQHYGRNFKQAAQDFLALEEQAAAEDLAQQVLANSIICDVKAKRCSKAMKAVGVALLTYTLSIPIFVSMAYTNAIHQAAAIQPQKSKETPTGAGLGK